MTRRSTASVAPPGEGVQLRHSRATDLVSSGRPLRVAFVCESLRFPEGGAETMRVRLLTRGLAELGHEVHVLVARVTEFPPDVLNVRAKGSIDGVSFEYLTGAPVRQSSFVRRRLAAVRGWLMMLFRLAELHRQGRLDAACLWCPSLRWTPYRALFTWWLNVLCVPAFLELDERPWSLSESRNVLESRLSPLQGMTGVIAISEYLQNWTRQEAARIGRRVATVRLPIVTDTEEYAASPYPSSDPPVVLYASSPAYGNALALVLEAMEFVWREFPSCELEVTGWSPSDAHRHLTGRGARVLSDSRVKYLGYIPRQELLRRYRESRALLVPLFDDVASVARFPTKIAEYLASARPVITMRIGEVRTYLRDGETALFALEPTAAAFAARIVAALEDPAMAARIGFAGRTVAVAAFDYASQARRLADAISGVAQH